MRAIPPAHEVARPARAGAQVAADADAHVRVAARRRPHLDPRAAAVEHRSGRADLFLVATARRVVVRQRLAVPAVLEQLVRIGFGAGTSAAAAARSNRTAIGACADRTVRPGGSASVHRQRRTSWPSSRPRRQDAASTSACPSWPCGNAEVDRPGARERRQPADRATERERRAGVGGGAEHDLQRAPGADLAGQREQPRAQLRRGRRLEGRLGRGGLELAGGASSGSGSPKITSSIAATSACGARADAGSSASAPLRTSTRTTRSPPVKRTLTNESPFGPAGTATSKMTFPRVSKNVTAAPFAVSTSHSTIPNAPVVASRGVPGDVEAHVGQVRADGREQLAAGVGLIPAPQSGRRGRRPRRRGRACRLGAAGGEEAAGEPRLRARRPSRSHAGRRRRRRGTRRRRSPARRASSRPRSALPARRRPSRVRERGEDGGQSNLRHTDPTPPRRGLFPLCTVGGSTRGVTCPRSCGAAAPVSWRN